MFLVPHGVPRILVKQEPIKLQLKQMRPLSLLEQGVYSSLFGISEAPVK